MRRWSPTSTSRNGEKCLLRNVILGPKDRLEKAASSSLLPIPFSPLPQWVLVSSVRPNQRLKLYVALRPTPRGLDSRRLVSGTNPNGRTPWISAPGYRKEYPP